MKISINYCSIMHYNKSTIIQWVYYFKKYTYIKGFIIRIFGLYINISLKKVGEKVENIFIAQPVLKRN